jgi:hypothetical protein
MKKILFAAIMIATAAFSAKAQTGSILVYGNVGISTTNNGVSGAPKSTTTSLNPAVGYQFNDNWTAGLSLGYSNTNNNVTVQQFSISPFIRYAKTISPIFSVYGQFQAGYIHTSFDPGGFSSNGFNAQLFPAVFINVKNGFGLNFSFGGLQYTTEKQSNGGPTTNTFGLTFGSGASFGISKNFGGHKG